MSTIRRPTCFLLPLCTVILLLCGLAPIARAEGEQLTVVAKPNRIVYGTDNRSTLIVTVLDGAGQPVADGTAVYFNTTLGTLPTVAYTRQGQVSVLMDNTTGPGLAVITVTVGAVRRTVNIEYLGQGGTAVAKPKRVTYRVKAKQVYYSVDQRVFDLRDEAEFIAPDFTIKANALQYNLNFGVIVAQDNITITAGERTLSAHNLRMTLGTPSGAIIVTEPDLSYRTFALPSLESTEDDTVRGLDFRPLNPQPTKTWILCRQAQIFPYEQIQFRHPQFYLDNFDRRLYGLPYHVLDLGSTRGGLFFNSEVSLTSDAGLNIDFPIYYAASEKRIGAVHFRHIAQGSSFFRGAEGFEMSIEEEYLLGDYADGGVYLDDVTRPTRSFAWEHNQDIGQTNIDLSTGYDRYDEDTPYTTRLGMTVTRPFGKAVTRLNTQWSGFEGNEYGVAELTLQWPGVKLGKTGLMLNLDPYLGYTRDVNAATDTDPQLVNTNFYQGMRMGVGFPSVNVLGGRLTPNLNNEYSHDQDGTLTQYFDAGVSYQRPVTKNVSTSLNYSVSYTQANTDPVKAKPVQRASLDLHGSESSVWGFHAYTNYDFDSKLFYHTLNTTYYLPWFRRSREVPRCYLQYQASMTSGGEQTLPSDQLFSFGWNLGYYNLVVRYSPTGNNAVTGIGTGTGKQWAVELVRQGW